MKLSANNEVWRVLGEPGRYAFDSASLEIEEGEGRLIATNGRTLAVIPVELSKGDEPGLVPGEALGTKRRGEECMECGHAQEGDVIGVPGEVLVSGGKAVVVPLCLEATGKFPEWRGVLPPADAPVAVELTISAALLHDLARALGAHFCGVKLRIPHPDKDGAIRSPIRVEGPDGAVGSIMAILPDPVIS